MSRLSIVWIVLVASITLCPVGCSDGSDDGVGSAAVEASVLGGPAVKPQEQETEPKEKKKSLRERFKEGASKVVKKGAELAEAGEVLLGAEMKPCVVAQNGGVYPDRELQDFLERIVLGMGEKIAKPDIPWDFTILNTFEMNAHALPGGKLFITRGLLAALDSEAQFAHVVGHEMGHVVERHMIKKWGVAAAREALVRAAAMTERKILEKDPADPVFVTAALGIGGHFASLKFSREQELESDERGVDYALAAGYDPREGKKTFEMFLRMKEGLGQDESILVGLLSTHPFDSDRIEKIDTYIQETYSEVLQGERSLVVSSDAWQDHRDRLRGVLPAYDKHRRAMALVAKAVEEGTQEGMEEALDLLDQAIADLPDHPALYFSRAYLKYITGRDAEAEKDLDRAISRDEAHFQARLLRGLIRKNAKRYEEAVLDFKAAARLFLPNPAPHFYLGECYEALGKKVKAAVSYGQAVLFAPKGSKIRELAAKRLAGLRDGE
ncbi:MAG: M48 family metalloprotease [Planctomycetota bacterium]|nr:M48 family metalloprotease [Planctomycetota bacterium]